MRDKGFAIKGNVKDYKHHYPGWSHSVRANIYPLIWLPDFRIWFEEVWKTERLLKYLGGLDPDSVPPIGKLLGLNEAQCAQQLKQKKSTKKLKAE